MSGFTDMMFENGFNDPEEYMNHLMNEASSQEDDLTYEANWQVEDLDWEVNGDVTSFGGFSANDRKKPSRKYFPDTDNYILVDDVLPNAHNYDTAFYDGYSVLSDNWKRVFEAITNLSITINSDAKLNGTIKYKRRDGFAIYELNFNEGMLHGLQTYCDITGGECILNFANGQKSGLQFVNLYERTGMVSRKFYCEDDRLHGAFTEFHILNGEFRIKYTGYYDCGIPDGKWTHYYNSGAIRQQFEISNSRLINEYIWHEERSGKILIRIAFNAPNEPPEGHYSDYHMDGNICRTGKIRRADWHTQFIDIMFFKPYGMKECDLTIDPEEDIKVYYRNGNLRYECESVTEGGYYREYYKNYREYYENGNLKFTGNKSVSQFIGVKGTKWDGEFEEFYENGNVKRRSCYNDGLLHGATQVFDENGKIQAEGLYLQSKKGSIRKDGWHREYYPTGILKKECRFDVNSYYNVGKSPIGLKEVKEYNEDGMLVKHIEEECSEYEGYCCYDDYPGLREVKEYNEDGKLVKHSVFKLSSHVKP